MTLFIDLTFGISNILPWVRFCHLNCGTSETLLQVKFFCNLICDIIDTSLWVKFSHDINFLVYLCAYLNSCIPMARDKSSRFSNFHDIICDTSDHLL